MISVNNSAIRGCVFGQLFAKAGAIKYVIAQYEGYTVFADEVCGYYKRLWESIGNGLLRIREFQSQPGAIAQEPAELWQVIRRRNDQYLLDTGQHEGRQGVIDHGLIVDRHDL